MRPFLDRFGGECRLGWRLFVPSRRRPWALAVGDARQSPSRQRLGRSRLDAGGTDRRPLALAFSGDAADRHRAVVFVRPAIACLGSKRGDLNERRIGRLRIGRPRDLRLGRMAFGDRVALWGLVPLAFSSNGVVWLSSRLTGGHLLAVAWHATAFAPFHSCLSRGGWKRGALLGFWSGLGLYVDAMFMFTWIGLISAAAWSAFRNGLNKRGLTASAAFVAASALGFAPAWIAARRHLRDDYPAQFSPTTNPELWWGHAKILALECVPRLISGRLLPDLSTEPDPAPWV